MSEYMEKHSVSKLIGSPPGYVGYDEGGQLTEAVRRKPYSVILLDEIERAHPDTFNILLQMLDEGRLTDNKGRVANFKNTIVIMTSNMGASIIQERFERIDMNKRMQVVEQTKNEVMAVLKKSIKPEFLNRIDEIVMFTPLNMSEVQDIVRLQIRNLQQNLAKKNIALEVSEEAIIYITNLGFDPQYGARPIKRVIQREILNPLSIEILAGRVTSAKSITIDVADGKIQFKN